jgi:uncharacterized protein DUF2637
LSDQPKNTKPGHGLWLSRAALGFVALAAVMGWGASFVGLHAYGQDQMVGFSYWSAWLIPATFDGAAFGATLITYRASIYGRSAVRGRLLMWTFTAISSWINWIHQTTPEARIVAAGLPVAAVAVFDVVLAELRADYEERHGKRRLRLRPGLLMLRWLVDRGGTAGAFRRQVTDIPVSEIAGLGPTMSHDQVISEASALATARDTAAPKPPGYQRIPIVPAPQPAPPGRHPEPTVAAPAQTASVPRQAPVNPRRELAAAARQAPNAPRREPANPGPAVQPGPMATTAAQQTPVNARPENAVATPMRPAPAAAKPEPAAMPAAQQAPVEPTSAHELETGSEAAPTPTMSAKPETAATQGEPDTTAAEQHELAASAADQSQRPQQPQHEAAKADDAENRPERTDNPRAEPETAETEPETADEPTESKPEDGVRAGRPTDEDPSEQTQTLPPVPADPLTDENKRTFARRDYRLSLELGQRYGFSERWGRRQIAAVRVEMEHDENTRARDHELIGID